MRDAAHGHALLRFLFEYGALAPAIGDDALPWRLAHRHDVIEVHAATDVPHDGVAFDELLVACGGAIAIARLVLARLGFESSVTWGLREGTHVASVCAGAWRPGPLAELPPMFEEAAPASELEASPARAELLEGWQRIASACGASLEIVQSAPANAALAVPRRARPLDVALRFALEGTRVANDSPVEAFPPFDDGFVARVRTNRRGPAGLVALGHVAASLALDARASGYSLAPGPLERGAQHATMAVAIGRARRASLVPVAAA